MRPDLWHPGEIGVGYCITIQQLWDGPVGLAWGSGKYLFLPLQNAKELCSVKMTLKCGNVLLRNYCDHWQLPFATDSVRVVKYGAHEEE